MPRDALALVRVPRARSAARGRAAPAAMASAMLFAAAIALVGEARADICKYVDSDGNTHYSNLPPEKGWRKVGCTSGDNTTLPRSVSGAAPRATSSSPAGFPRVDPDTQKGRDDIRKKVLSDELAAEEKQLAETRVLYADGAPIPMPEERADAEKYRARIARLRQTVIVHERNIEALKKELSAIK
jgi:hypothetical protein